VFGGSNAFYREYVCPMNRDEWCETRVDASIPWSSIDKVTDDHRASSTSSFSTCEFGACQTLTPNELEECEIGVRVG
jgi:hypothetical protein